ncbi:hypothetical protein MLD38_037382 [Melastoma candidum]|uniref:Uncharacterized protein n=1 Tax=Melastoma candidum TaxID=119954 RepID=A0ACB9LMW3_9MYRT|nr:hypothetical protein MLD38_037382 [Melastoma candidum]
MAKVPQSVDFALKETTSKIGADSSITDKLACTYDLVVQMQRRNSFRSLKNLQHVRGKIVNIASVMLASASSSLRTAFRHNVQHYAVRMTEPFAAKYVFALDTSRFFVWARWIIQTYETRGGAYIFGSSLYSWLSEQDMGFGLFEQYGVPVSRSLIRIYLPPAIEPADPHVPR